MYWFHSYRESRPTFTICQPCGIKLTQISLFRISGDKNWEKNRQELKPGISWRLLSSRLAKWEYTWFCFWTSSFNWVQRTWSVMLLRMSPLRRKQVKRVRERRKSKRRKKTAAFLHPVAQMPDARMCRFETQIGTDMVWNAPWSGEFSNAHHFVCTFFQFHVFRLLGGSCAPATQTAADTWETLTLPVSLAHQTPTVRWENKIFVNWLELPRIKRNAMRVSVNPSEWLKCQRALVEGIVHEKHLERCFWNQTSHGADYKTTLD